MTKYVLIHIVKLKAEQLFSVWRLQMLQLLLVFAQTALKSGRRRRVSFLSSLQYRDVLTCDSDNGRIPAERTERADALRIFQNAQHSALKNKNKNKKTL